jgi:hypothetical protein
LKSLKRELTTCFTESTTGGRILLWHDFVRMLSRASFQATSPRNAKFRIDVYDVDSRRDCLAQVFIIGSRTTVEGQEDLSRSLDLRYSLDIQVLFRFSALTYQRRWSQTRH